MPEIECLMSQGCCVLISLLQANLSVERNVQPAPRYFQRDWRGIGGDTRRFPARDRSRHCVLDLALRIDADHFEELANADIQCYFVHGYAPAFCLHKNYLWLIVALSRRPNAGCSPYHHATRPTLIKCFADCSLPWPDAVLARLIATSELQHGTMEKNCNNRFQSSIAGARVCEFLPNANLRNLTAARCCLAAAAD